MQEKLSITSATFQIDAEAHFVGSIDQESSQLSFKCGFLNIFSR